MADFRSGRRVNIQFQGAGARPWFLERRDGPAQGIYTRLVADRSFSSKQILTEVQHYLETLHSASRHSAYQMAFGSRPAGFLAWGATDEDLLLAQDTSLLGQSALQ